MKFFHARQSAYHTDARMIDNAIYTPYRYDDMPSTMKKDDGRTPTGTLVDIDEPGVAQNPPRKARSKFLVAQDHLADVFVFSYGVVVLWGMAEAQEKRFLTSL
jgi:uncharacterized Rmd1/YagE family protein